MLIIYHKAAARQFYFMYGSIPNAIKSSYSQVDFDNSKFGKAKSMN